MSRKRLILVILLAGLVVVGTATALYARSRFYVLGGVPPQATETEPAQVATVCPGAPSPSTPSIPAITPRNDCTPSFTEQDVREYVSQLHGVGRILFWDQPTITHIWFITSMDAAALTGEAPPSNLVPPVVCVVELTVTFLPAAGPAVQHGHIVIIFDAHTGNMLEEQV